jgi:DNA repair protein RadC
MKITSPAEAFHFLRKRFRTEVEEFWALALSSEKDVIRAACLFRGTVDFCMFHPRDVFRFAYLHNAASLIVAHNHPSGSALASAEDKTVTQQLLIAAELLQVPIVDHIILGGKTYYSFLEAGELIPLPAVDPSPDGQ